VERYLPWRAGALAKEANVLLNKSGFAAGPGIALQRGRSTINFPHLDAHGEMIFGAVSQGGTSALHPSCRGAFEKESRFCRGNGASTLPGFERCAQRFASVSQLPGFGEAVPAFENK
jgi:hypothetical protein